MCGINASGFLAIVVKELKKYEMGSLPKIKYTFKNANATKVVTFANCATINVLSSMVQQNRRAWKIDKN